MALTEKNTRRETITDRRELLIQVFFFSSHSRPTASNAEVGDRNVCNIRCLIREHTSKINQFSTRYGEVHRNATNRRSHGQDIQEYHHICFI